MPPALARFLAGAGHRADHVVDLNLGSAKDGAIWNYALAEGAVVVTKDQDFVHLATLRAHGPQVLWVRLGNTSRAEVLHVFGRLLPSVLSALASGARVVEVA